MFLGDGIKYVNTGIFHSNRLFGSFWTTIGVFIPYLEIILIFLYGYGANILIICRNPFIHGLHGFWSLGAFLECTQHAAHTKCMQHAAHSTHCTCNAPRTQRATQYLHAEIPTHCNTYTLQYLQAAVASRSSQPQQLAAVASRSSQLQQLVFYGVFWLAFVQSYMTVKF